MKNIRLEVNKANVYEEIAELSAYVGAKKVGDDNAFGRISITDNDRRLLERFWSESCSFVTDKLKRFFEVSDVYNVSHGVELGRNYVVTLKVSRLFDNNIIPSIEASLFSYFINSIVVKWYSFTNKEDAEIYAHEAGVALQDVISKIFHKKRPLRS